MPRLLELFSGTKSISKVAKTRPKPSEDSAEAAIVVAVITTAATAKVSSEYRRNALNSHNTRSQWQI